MAGAHELSDPLVDVLHEERAILGAFLLHPAAVDQARQGGLTAADFFRHAHRLIFDAAIRLRDDGRDVDLIGLKAILGPLALEDVGGLAYLTALVDGIPPKANIEPWVEHVRTVAAARRLREICNQASSDLTRDPKTVRNGLPGTLRAAVDAVTAATQRAADPFQTAQSLCAAATADVPYITKPYFVEGAVTEITGKAKAAGKTALLTHWAACRIGGLDFLGQPTKQGHVVYLTEEPPTAFRQALARAGLEGVAELHVLSYWAVRHLDWPAIVELAIRKAQAVGNAPIIVDTLGRFAGLAADQENNSGDADRIMAPLQQAAALGLAVVVSRHERKGGGELGESGRGSSAFTGAADIILSLSRPDGNMRDTIRVLRGMGRFESIPPTLMIERIHSRPLGGGFGEYESVHHYIALGSETAIAAHEAESAILESLPGSEDSAMNRDELQKAHAHVKGRTLDRALKELVDRHQVQRIGSGRKGSAYRYFRSIEALQ